MGGSSARGFRATAHRHDSGRHPVLERARRGVRVFQLWVRDPRTDRVPRLWHAVHGLRDGERHSSAGDDVDDARALEGSRRSSGARLPVGRRAMEGRAAARQRVVRLDGWHADDGGGPESIRRGVPVRVAAARRRRTAAAPPGIAARDAAGLAARLGGGDEGRGWRTADDEWGLRLRPPNLADLHFPFVVAHSGGLPGFGSQMRWLPDYGVGIVAFGNLTYTGGAGRSTRCSRPSIAPAVSCRGRCSHRRRSSPRAMRSLASWSPGTMRWPIGSPQRTCSWTRARSAAVRKSRRCTPRSARAVLARGSPTVENALRGDWTMACDRGPLRVAITLAPTNPPKVQFMSIRPAPADIAENGDVPALTVGHCRFLKASRRCSPPAGVRPHRAAQ